MLLRELKYVYITNLIKIGGINVFAIVMSTVVKFQIKEVFFYSLAHLRRQCQVQVKAFKFRRNSHS